MTEELINKYRPKLFKEVIGQETVCKSIRAAIVKGRTRSVILSGPSGVGKTTLGRIMAKTVGCSPLDIIEIDGATNTGIEKMREVTSRLKYKSFGNQSRVIIVDECHAISAAAFKSLLKPIEEPPEGVYWILCTTELGKVPKEVKNRCTTYELKPVTQSKILRLITDISAKEKLPIRRCEGGLETIAELAQGSPRLALSMLAKAAHLTEEEDIEALCAEAGVAGQEAIDLCRALMGNPSWKQLCGIISKIDAPPESVRIVILRYMTSVALKKPKPVKELAIMEAFGEPFQDREGKAPLLMACGMLLFD